MEQASTDLMRFTEAADYLRVTTEALRRWRQKDIGPQSFMMAGRRMFRRSELDRWLRECEQRAAVERVSA